MTVEKKRVRKAVLPVAGLGTRLLPATKAVPKEMLSILGKPMIQYAVEECHASGIEEIIFVTAPHKDAIRAHFERDELLEKSLAKQGRKKEGQQVRELSKLANLRFVLQEQPLGLGHAVLCAEQAIGQEPLAVLLSDVFLLGLRLATRQLIEVYEERGVPIFAIEHIARERVSQCGIVDGEPLAEQDRLLRVRNIIEKPKPEAVPSDLGIVGRYVLGPEIFDCLERMLRGVGGEVQLSDALSILSREEGLLAYVCEGKSVDADDRDGLFKVAVEMALRDRKLGSWLRRLGLSDR